VYGHLLVQLWSLTSTTKFIFVAFSTVNSLRSKNYTCFPMLAICLWHWISPLFFYLSDYVNRCLFVVLWLIAKTFLTSDFLQIFFEVRWTEYLQLLVRCPSYLAYLLLRCCLMLKFSCRVRSWFYVGKYWLFKTCSSIWLKIDTNLYNLNKLPSTNQLPKVTKAS
jgi:hypothetical protein